MIQVDHIAIAARDPRASAGALADILGLGEPVTDGADDDMYRIDLDHGSFLLFSTAATVEPQHMAFRVDHARFGAVLERLRSRGVAFGNEPEDPRNGKTDDPLGGAGRIYFLHADGHLFEVTC
jgi:catechol 2,3-dioxygenase-like lactoylglutathione lyase family enzyme